MPITRSTVPSCRVSLISSAHGSTRLIVRAAAVPWAPKRIWDRQVIDSPYNASLPYASSLCGACFDACPVRIDIPSLLVRLRAQHVDAQRATGSGPVRCKTDASVGPRTRSITSSPPYTRVPRESPIRSGLWLEMAWPCCSCPDIGGLDYLIASSAASALAG